MLIYKWYFNIHIELSIVILRGSTESLEFEAWNVVLLCGDMLLSRASTIINLKGRRTFSGHNLTLVSREFN